MLKKLTSLLLGILLPAFLYASKCATTQHSSGNNTFCNPSIWSCNPGGTTNLTADTLIIQHNIEIQNECIIQASVIIIKSGYQLEFKGNGKLIMTTSGAKVEIEDGALLKAPNQSSQTLIEIDNEPVWGGASPSGNNDVPGPAIISGSGILFLPLKWLDITVDRSSHYAILSWSTTAEENCSHFEVIRSRDGNTWDALGEVAAVNRFEGENSYSFTDKYPLPGESFYQVVQYDFNGLSSKSPIVSLVSPIGDARFFPNPTSGSLSATFDRSWVGGTVTVFDPTGRTVGVYPISIQNQAINLGMLPAGLYMLRLENQGMQLTYPLVKQ